MMEAVGTYEAVLITPEKKYKLSVHFRHIILQIQVDTKNEIRLQNRRYN